MIPIPYFEHRVMVLASDIDENIHANNISYVRWMQEAALAHSTANGWSPERVRDSGYAWVARRHTVDYLVPAVEGERITVITWVIDMKLVRSTRRYKFIRESDGVLIAHAETLWAFVSAETGRPIKIPKEVEGCFCLVDDVNHTKSEHVL